MNLLTALSKSDTSTDAQFHSVDDINDEVILLLDQSVSDQAPVRLTLPCGSRQVAYPKWKRRVSDKTGKAMAAFQLQNFDKSQWLNLANGCSRAPRDYPRVEFRTWISFPELAQRGTVTKDLSLQGCRVQGSLEDRVGETVRAYLELPLFHALLELRAKIVWSTSQEAGLQFQNLSVKHELALLQALGQSTIPPSSFLPNIGIVAPFYVYSASQADEVLRLNLSVSNWDVRFEISGAKLEGADRGAYQYALVLDCSDQIQQMRASEKIPLRNSLPYVHIILMDSDRRKVFEVVGREVGFKRQPRRALSAEMDEVLT